MLQRWKEKFKQLFTTETETPKKKHTYHVPQTLQTKITYQYPRNSRFRFPVIPDEPLDTPAYLRKQQITGEADFSDKKITKQKDDDQDSLRKKEPFRPSRVASPIYGYRPRESMSDLEQVPAYIRKQKAQTKQHDHVKINSDYALLTEDNDDYLMNDLIEQDSNNNEWPNDIPFSQSRSEMSAQKEEEVNVTTDLHTTFKQVQGDNTRHLRRQSHSRSQQRTQQQEQRDKNVRPAQEKPSGRPSQEKSNVRPTQVIANSFTSQEKSNVQNSQEKPTGRASRDKPIPFNVMMTPRDKMKLRTQDQGKKPTDHHPKVKANRPHDYQIPVHLLNDVENGHHEDKWWIKEQQTLLEQTLTHFNVKAKVVQATQGPSVTRFEVQPALGVKVSRVRNLSDDIKLNMAAKDIRIEAPIPGKHTIGIEVPNQKTQTVGLQEILQTNAFKRDQSPLTIGLGLDVEGRAKVTDIAKMPHGLIAGATGSGKSVCINTIIISLLYKSSYEDVKLLLIDPKMVELTPYNGIPHLIAPVITDIKAATAALQWAVKEMEERYQKFATERVRSIEKYNEKMLAQNRQQEKMPYIVIIIDELADLMMVAPQDVEEAISRIAQKARACGIHLIVATQRPSVDVITGLIKANIPTRIAFSVSSQVDSRTIIDMNGAERLLGKGDMLFIENGTGKARRLQGAFVSDEEIDRITTYLKQLSQPNYLFEQEHLVEKMEIAADEDEILPEVIEFVVDQTQVSTSLLQRQFRIGYNRAARLIDTLEDKGIISGQNGSKPRDVLVSKEKLQDNIPS